MEVLTLLLVFIALLSYSKRHNKFLFPALAEAINGSSCKAENEISDVVNYNRSGNSEREIREHI